MKTTKMLTILVLALGLMVCFAQVGQAAPMGTAFTYQGRLIDANSAADGLYDFEFKLYDSNDPCTGTQLGSPIDINDLDVIDGYFTVELDFGSGVFDGDAVWLQIGVRPGDMNDPNVYTVLEPRQELTAVPYALQIRGIFVDDAGNVGIGTTSPAARLDVEGDGTDTPLELDGKGMPDYARGIRLTNTGMADGTNMNFNIGKADNPGQTGEITYYHAGDANPDNMLSLGLWGPGKILNVKYDGNVGIGTTSPRGKLDVEGNQSNIYLDTWTAQIYIGDIDGDGDETLFTVDDNAGTFTFENGNVGIGTTTPSTKLDVVGTVNATAFTGDGSGLTNLPTGITVETDPTVLASVKDGVSWAELSTVPAGFADGVDDAGLTVALAVVNNYGNTWTAKESNRKWRSVAMSEDGTKQTAVALNERMIYVSTDSGNTWTAKDTYLDEGDWMSVAMSADGTKQTAVVHEGQIYVSTDSGNTWTAKESNRDWMSVAMSADGTKQTAVVIRGQIYVSMDSGNTWTAKESNRYWWSVAMSADGTKQTAVVSEEGRIYVSTDSGNTWTAKESNRYWWSVAMSTDGTKQTAVGNSEQIYVSYADVSFTGNIGIGGNVGIGTTSPQGKLDVNGSIYQRGLVLHADYVFEPGYKLESIEEHSEFMWRQKHLKAIPKANIDENGKEIIEVGAHRRGIVEELEKAHIYIEQLHRRINELQQRNNNTEARLAQMETVVAKQVRFQEGVSK